MTTMFPLPGMHPTTTANAPSAPARPVVPHAPPDRQAANTSATPSSMMTSSLDELLHRAAEARFPDHKVQVEGFTDEATGRFVVRIADQTSGQVLAQTPPEPLLRFYASMVKDLDALLEVDA